MSAPSHHNQNAETQALALGSYRHDVAYTAALKSQALALGSYRYDIAYTGALKSVQLLACTAIVTGMEALIECLQTGVDSVSAPVLFWQKSAHNSVYGVAAVTPQGNLLPKTRKLVKGSGFVFVTYCSYAPQLRSLRPVQSPWRVTSHRDIEPCERVSTNCEHSFVLQSGVAA